MFTLYDNIVRICDEHGIKPSRMCVEAGISKSIMTRLKNDKNSSITTDIAQKIADYFGISVGEVLNERARKMSYGNTPLAEMKKAATPKDDGALLRFALYGDPAEEITDDDIERILDYARYVREKKKGDSR